MKRLRLLLPLLILIGPYSYGDSHLEKIEPSIDLGAKVYKERCVLCHGNVGMGEGVLPLKMGEYPDTNLVVAIKDKNRIQVQEAVIYGGTTGKISEFMPPMGNDLTWTETESVVDFVMLLKNEQSRAIELLRSTVVEIGEEWKIGQQLYESRCALCHGKYGEGDGRMSKVIKTPPPANLTASRVPDDYLKSIIKQGGQGVGRSSQMPPWGMQFDDGEINAIVFYIKTLRH